MFFYKLLIQIQRKRHKNYLLDKANNTGYKEGMPIRLLGCNMGAGYNSFAEQLSKILMVKVEAADKYFFFRSDGSYNVYGSKGEDKKGNIIKNIKSPGKMISYDFSKKR